MKHVFKATKLGWEKEKEGIWFDSDDYTAQEAKDEFEDDEVPLNDLELLDYRLRHFKK